MGLNLENVLINHYCLNKLNNGKSYEEYKKSASYIHYFLPQTKKLISRTFKIRGTLVFLCPKERDGDKERDRERERERESKRER